MRIAVFESIVTAGGHEHDFDKLLVNELKKLGHLPEMVVPENYPFKLDYEVPVRQIPGEAVSYTGVSGLRKAWLSATREIRRVKWFNSLMRLAQSGAFDAIIVPTATYRFLRSVRLSALKRSPVPVLSIMHGINPGEADRFFAQCAALSEYQTIRQVVITLGRDLFGKTAANIHCVKPPVFAPGENRFPPPAADRPLTLGFFGQYRREKNLDGFLTVYRQCDFTEPVRLLVQGATSLPEDAADFRRIQEKYADCVNIEFLHKALIGPEWQQAIAGVDALIMPYAAERYRYHWSAMLFTALGFQKPMIVADSINPEVLADYELGVAFNPHDSNELRQALETFVNTYPTKRETYARELDRANRDFAPARFVQAVLAVAGLH